MKSMAILLTASCLLPLATVAQEPTQQIMKAYCETPPYYPTQGGENCRSDWQQMTAPEGYVFAKESASGGVTSSIPGEKAVCDLEWDLMRDVLPNIPQPARVKLRAYGEMNQGYGEGGHTRCEYRIPLVKVMTN